MPDSETFDKNRGHPDRHPESDPDRHLGKPRAPILRYMYRHAGGCCWGARGLLLGCEGVCWGAGRAAAGVLGGLLLGGWWGACSGYRLRCVPPCLRGVEKVHESDAKHDEDLRFRGVRLEASGGPIATT